MTIEGLLISPTKIISTMGGNVLHAIKKSDEGYSGFGEAYFSTIEPNAIKAWKRHREMTLNLLVPIGEVRFVIYDDRPNSQSRGLFQQLVLSQDNYKRLTIPPQLWLGFQGIGTVQSMLINIANVQHDPMEIDRKSLDSIPFNWS
jgi:dTDP-4-dehydrorhamnose 3,5-epimerase